MFLFPLIPEHLRPLLRNVRNQNTQGISKFLIENHRFTLWIPSIYEIIMYIQIAIYWWCFGSETYVKICGCIQLWGENRLCFNFTEIQKTKWNRFYPTNEHFSHSQKIYTILFMQGKWHFVKNYYKTWKFSGFQKVIISLVISFKKSEKSVNKLRNTVVKMKKIHFF